MNKKIAVLIIIGILVLAVISRFVIPTTQEKYISENCPGYHYNPGFVGPRAEFIDCKNNIGIEKYSDEDVLTVFNGRFLELRNWDSFQIHSYKIVDDKIYYMEDSSINNGQPTYFAATEWPDVTIPSLFRVIDTQTTEISLYKTLQDVPSDERNIFGQLEQ